jgi:DNA-binding response OmpR family regulator
MKFLSAKLLGSDRNSDSFRGPVDDGHSAKDPGCRAWGGGYVEAGGMRVGSVGDSGPVSRRGSGGDGHGGSGGTDILVGKKVLVVDDNHGFRESLVAALRYDGVTTAEAENGEQGLAEVASFEPDCVVLDINMPPGIDGFETLRRIRRDSRVPVLFLSDLGGEDDQVRGLDLGAHDYVSKEDYSLRLFRARLRSCLRVSAARQRSDGSSRKVIGQLAHDMQAKEFAWAGQTLDLTTTQYLLLAKLFAHPTQVFERDKLMDAIHPEEHGNVVIEPKTIDSHVAGIRRALKPYNVSRGTVIRSRPRFGYSMGDCR